MTDEERSPGLWTAANLVTFGRLAAIPIFLWLLLGADDVLAAAVVFVVIGLTDWVDGQLARRLGQVSSVGKVIDPLADRLAILAAVVGGALADILPVWFVVLLLARELLLGVFAVVLAARRRRFIQVRYLGKLATFAVYGAVPAFYLAAAGVAKDLFYAIGMIVGAAGLVLYWWVGLQYVGDYRRMLRQEGASV